jgi:tetratricopeptide (TPR) repeat protein
LGGLLEKNWWKAISYLLMKQRFNWQVTCTILVLLFAFGCASKNSLPNKSETQPGHADIHALLADFVNGDKPYAELFLEENTQLCKDILRYYSQGRNQLTLDEQLVVACCFVRAGDLHSSIRIAEEYVKTYTNSANGWQVLGNCYARLGERPKAIAAHEKAVEFGADNSLPILAGLLLSAGQLDRIEPLVPGLLALKSSEDYKEERKLEAVCMLTIYAVKTRNEALFLKALEGVNVDDFLAREDMDRVIGAACNIFDTTKFEDFCRRVSAQPKTR